LLEKEETPLESERALPYHTFLDNKLQKIFQICADEGEGFTEKGKTRILLKTV
jgi:hypothetical protein